MSETIEFVAEMIAIAGLVLCVHEFNARKFIRGIGWFVLCVLIAAGVEGGVA